jgi:hypothetical protein
MSVMESLVFRMLLQLMQITKSTKLSSSEYHGHSCKMVHNKKMPSVDVVNRCKEFTTIGSTISLPASKDSVVLTGGKLQISDRWLREEHGLMVFESRVQRRTFEPEREDATGGSDNCLVKGFIISTPLQILVRSNRGV